MELVDTHCHIHGADYELDAEVVYTMARDSGVKQMICVGTDGLESERAVKFAQSHNGCWASVGLHPHDAKHAQSEYELVETLAHESNVVAIGECGLDYYYSHSPKKLQTEALHWQMALASQLNLPMIFHVRDAFKDFWPIYDSYSSLPGVVHSFTGNQQELEQIVDRNLYVGLNGIMTFTKVAEQRAMAKSVPLDKMVLETDSPYLTPVPQRGKVNEPRYVRLVVDFLAELRQEDPSVLAEQTTHNARKLFNLE